MLEPDELPVRWLNRPDGTRLAYRLRPGRRFRHGLLWLGGFRSDMAGTKATALDGFARERGLRFLRFDYSGHGLSDGAFEDGTIGRWLEDTLTVIDALAEGPQILLGSSMGAWIALLAARARPLRVKALLLIAPAVDFTETLMWARFSEKARAEVRERGVTYLEPTPSAPEPCPVTRALIEEGRQHLLLDEAIPLDGPVRILQGMRDEQVPWQHALKVLDKLTTPDAVMSLVKDGDHGLSDDSNIARLKTMVSELCAKLEGTE
jgi:pimeloyl-ACP methyl ester carboxylesterase